LFSWPIFQQLLQVLGILGIAEVALFNRPDSLPIAQPKMSKHVLPVAEHHV